MMMLLQARGCMSAHQLAEQLEVSKRTIYRDVEALSIAGVPIYTQPGVRGGIFLDEDYRVSLTGLDKTEVLSLFVSGKTGPLADLGLADNIENALLKLFATLPSIHRREVEWMRQRVFIDPANWFQVLEPVPFFPLIQQAVWENRVIEGVYQRSDGALVDRNLDAYGLVAKSNIWYLVGRKPDGNYRSYRIFRFKKVQLKDHFFDRCPEFDLAAYWKVACRAYEAFVAKETPLCTARVRVHPSIMWYFDSLLTGKFEQISTSDSTGWITLHVLFDSTPEARAVALRFGDFIEVIEPLELRDEVTNTARAIVRFYDL
jgi:predicted DNA-binding transcriptional regulator YafY